jgi:hypothetical protein
MQLVNKPENMKNICNNILQCKPKPPSILGCFQLYKKQNCFHSDNFDDASAGDYYFGYTNFDLFCNLGNLQYFHLGVGGINWKGKVISFVDDINISITDIYYNCSNQYNNFYYNKTNQIVQYGSSKNINDDIWTCSDKMRYDIYNFFKDMSYFKIAEIGSHKGYTTKILANIFSKVYAVDNSIEFTDYNKNYNKYVKNIEYVMLDLYNDNWDSLPDDISVSFIDAQHDYNACKSDIMNSIQRFKNLQYIVFDDYGVWPGVKQIVDELLQNKTFIFERFIGINNVLGPNGIVKNVNEGIICKINKNMVSPPSRTFTPRKKMYMNMYMNI